MNNINLTGRICRDLELKYTQRGKAVTSFDLAVKRPRVKDTTDFLTVIVWNQSAEYICRYGHKGALVEVSGCLTTRKYQDKSGNNRVAYEIVADIVSLLQSKESNEGGVVTTPSENFAPAANNEPTFAASNVPSFEEMDLDSDLPF